MINNLKNLLNIFNFYQTDAETISRRKKILRSFKAKADAKRTPAEKIADVMTKRFGSITFLVLNSIVFVIWIVINTNITPNVADFDPFPFSLLTTAVSLEAIILAVFVLISQNRAARIDDLREELELEINVIAEKEITKVMQMLALLLEKNGIDISKDPELAKMLKPISHNDMEKILEKELEEMIRRVSFLHRPDDKKAIAWKEKITQWFNKKYPKVKIVDNDWDVLIVMGGDGTVLEGARQSMGKKSMMLGLNLGTVGFLSSVRKPVDFIPSLEKMMKSEFFISHRHMINAAVNRKSKKIYSTTALNEVAVIDPIGMVKLKVFIEDQEVQSIRGTGVILASATGSTAFNLSAHGPLVAPESESVILTEIMDHDIPNPSLVLSNNEKIKIVVSDFRRRNLLTVASTGEPADVLMVSDGQHIFPLEKNDEVNLSKSPVILRLIEFQKRYFLKSIRDKLAFG